MLVESSDRHGRLPQRRVEMMSDRPASRQVKILSLTLRILLVSGRITQTDLLRAAKIAAAEVRARRPLEPPALIALDEKNVTTGEA